MTFTNDGCSKDVAKGMVPLQVKQSVHAEQSPSVTSAVRDWMSKPREWNKSMRCAKRSRYMLKNVRAPGRSQRGS